MPTIQSAELWRESGRYDDYGKEMLRIEDRHEREMLYGPTNEEMITSIFRSYVRSYKDIPLNLYHIQWKFRDEVRPRFGVMRGREFLMKDAYSFDIDQAGARHSYNKMFVAYLRTFARLGLKAIPMVADTGPIGGNLSHEFIILASTGESEVFCHKDYLDFPVPAADVDFNNIAGLQAQVDKWTSLYAATSEKHDAAAFGAIPADKQVSARGIEVGHIFYFGTKYSKPMGAVVAGLVIATGLKLLPALRSNPLGFGLGLAWAALSFVCVAVLRWPLIWVLLGLGGVSCGWAARQLRRNQELAAR